MATRLQTWTEVGARVAAARIAAGFTQEQLAERLGLHRSALTRVEQGQRQIDALELIELAEALGRSAEWFVTSPPAMLASHRRERSEEVDVNRLEDRLEQFARDVELLLEIRELTPNVPRLSGGVDSLEAAESAAGEARELVGLHEGPAHDLQAICERTGLYSASLDLGPAVIDGGYVQMPGAGAAVVNGVVDPGRRRFNLAHELGHHLFADEYATDFAIGQSSDQRERLINAFAIHFLMPRSALMPNWEELRGAGLDTRGALIHVAAAFRVSWSAACTQARNLRLIDHETFTRFEFARPTAADYVELGVSFEAEMTPPKVSPAYARSVLRAHRNHKLGAIRAVELLRGTVRLDDLRQPAELPLDALRDDFANPHAP